MEYKFETNCILRNGKLLSSASEYIDISFRIGENFFFLFIYFRYKLPVENRKEIKILLSAKMAGTEEDDYLIKLQFIKNII